MENSQVFVSRSHGGYDEYGSFINVDKGCNTSKFHSSQIYDYATHTALFDLSNCDLAIFIGCYTSYTYGLSLPDAAVAAGAQYAIGFGEILTCEKANQWMEKFFESYCSGSQVEYAAQVATAACSGAGGVSSYRVVSAIN